VKGVLRYIMVPRFTGGGCLRVYHGAKIYWWRMSWGISWCHGLLVKGVLRYIMVSRFTSGGYLEVYHGVKVY
jgi:hypothetical protein